MPEQGEADRNELRQRLLNAAWHCVARKGYRDITVDDVCTEAMASEDSFHCHFETKQDLLLALLDEDVAQIDRRIEEVKGQNLTQPERVRRFTSWTLERDGDASRARVRAELWGAALTDERARVRLSHAIGRRRALLRVVFGSSGSMTL